MIAVLCYSCSTHISNTDVDRLDWPLLGDMFSPAYPGWYLRPGPLNLDIFCPICSRFPFHHDPYTAGGGAVGKFLNVRGADGKPVVMTVKQILMQAWGAPLEMTYAVSQPQPLITIKSIQEEVDKLTGMNENMPKEFPCPSCGAKKRFHKKGCTVTWGDRSPEVRGGESQISGEQPPQVADPHLLAMEARVSSGPERSETPTADDLKDLERDRELRASDRPDPELRPGEGFIPKEGFN
ncbi:MAG: hypothetical protein WC600_18145 [Desulfobaccales bacterium]